MGKPTYEIRQLKVLDRTEAVRRAKAGKIAHADAREEHGFECFAGTGENMEGLAELGDVVHRGPKTDADET